MALQRRPQSPVREPMRMVEPHCCTLRRKPGMLLPLEAWLRSRTAAPA
eukprot:CAMPEP_0185209046 /NCGR_PEP_ID=MMETSP1140-20130426/63069_1 /TAXON_ID=298111 /ORGANISM="Pavlova sp., Strain CCMP459" /LENGTH=47 /DNA_ID= /DNA_START= /DNA_END= /DNA_ORIENTATION=